MRARRRHDRERAIAHARRVHTITSSRWQSREAFDRWLDRMDSRLADNLANCSCWMCCSRRRIDGPTRPELAADLVLSEDLVLVADPFWDWDEGDWDDFDDDQPFAHLETPRFELLEVARIL